MKIEQLEMTYIGTKRKKEFIKRRKNLGGGHPTRKCLQSESCGSLITGVVWSKLIKAEKRKPDGARQSTNRKTLINA